MALPARMREIHFDGKGGPEVIRVREVDVCELFLLPDFADVDRLPDEVRA